MSLLARRVPGSLVVFPGQRLRRQPPPSIRPILPIDSRFVPNDEWEMQHERHKKPRDREHTTLDEDEKNQLSVWLQTKNATSLQTDLLYMETIYALIYTKKIKPDDQNNMFIQDDKMLKSLEGFYKQNAGKHRMDRESKECALRVILETMDIWIQDIAYGQGDHHRSHSSFLWLTPLLLRVFTTKTRNET